MTTCPSDLIVKTACARCGQLATDELDIQHIASYGVCWSCFHANGHDLTALDQLPGLWDAVGWLPGDDPDAITFDQAVWAFRTATAINTATRFWLGDLLEFGERRWGDKYTEAISHTGLSYDTLARYAYVCRQVSFFTRVKNLTWTHHLTVASLPPGQQRYWLARAESEELTTRQLAEKISLVRLAVKTVMPALAWVEGNDASPGWVVRCPGCGADFDLLDGG